MDKLNYKIYLDHAATTPVDSRVFEAIKPYFTGIFGNPGSLHSFGREASEAIAKSRKTIADFLGCKPEEIIFTSGGSEADNLAIRGLIAGERRKAKGESRPHIITSAFEHKAVLDTVKDLEKTGEIEATYIKPDRDGQISVEDIGSAIKENTILVSIMYVNNEVGTIQPIREIGAMLKEINRTRDSGLGNQNLKDKNLKPVTRDLRTRIYFHTDAVQAIEYCNVDVNQLNVDLLTLTAHKIYGPKGIGALYVRAGTLIKPLIIGGGQERGLRAGTENTAGIVGFAKAIELVKQEKKSNYPDQLKGLRDRLIDGILKSISKTQLNGDREQLSPAIANISFVNAEGESILLYLDNTGIAVSTGSACTSRTLEPSHVLTAMSIPPEEAHGSIRFSLGRATTEDDIEKVLEILPDIIERIRKMSPFN